MRAQITSAGKYCFALGALGAVAAYLGFLGSQAAAQFQLLPMAMAMGLGLAGWVLLTRHGRLFERSADAFARAAPGKGQGQDAAVRPVRKGYPARGSQSQAGRFSQAALLGHEMKNYLCTLKGNTRLLRQRVKATDSDIIDRIDRVVEKLESFTRGMEESPDAVGNGVLWQVRICDTAKGCVATHFPCDAASFQWQFEENAPGLLGDPDRLEQVFLNLYANALEAGARRVITSSHRNGGWLQLRVEDDGWGCAQEDLARIFEPFFTTKSGPVRRGLGMFVVQSIVENHGGSIQVNSKNGSSPNLHGLIFTLDFPISRSFTLGPPRVGQGFAAAPASRSPVLPESV